MFCAKPVKKRLAQTLFAGEGGEHGCVARSNDLIKGGGTVCHTAQEDFSRRVRPVEPQGTWDKLTIGKRQGFDNQGASQAVILFRFVLLLVVSLLATPAQLKAIRLVIASPLRPSF